MKNIILRYFLDEIDGNHRILVAPTGSGKTYNWEEAICDLLEYEKKEYGCFDINRKVIFVTKLLKNLNISRLKLKIIERGLMTEDEFEHFVLMYNSKLNNFLSVYDSVLPKINKISFITKHEDYKEFIKAIEIIKEYQNNTRFKNIYEQNKILLERDYEPKFKNLIKLYLVMLYDIYNEKDEDDSSGEKRLSKSQKITEVLNNEKYGDLSWVTDLYPGTFLDKKKIIFMSLDRLLLPNSTVRSNEGPIWKSQYVDNAYITIDEIDSSKEQIYERIINSAQTYNFRDVFYAIYETFAHVDIEKHFDGLILKEKTKKLWQNIQKNLKVIADEYNMECRFITEIIDYGSNFMFNSGVTNLIVSSKGEVLRAIVEMKEKTNIIRFLSYKEKINKEYVDFSEMYNRINAFLATVVYALNKTATEYYQIKNKDFHVITFYDAVSTVVHRLFTSDDWRRYYQEKIINTISHYKKTDKEKDKEKKTEMLNKNDYDFCTTGFSFLEFVNSTKHNADTFIKTYTVSITPEAILIDLASRAKVLGISATGDAVTSIKNYDLDSIRRHLGVDNLFFEKEDEQKLISQNKQIYKHYNDININTNYLLRYELCYAQNYWASLFKGKPRYTNDIISKLPNDQFVHQRYFNIASVIHQFWINYDKIPLGIIMLNKLPKKDDPTLDLNLILSIADYIIKSHNKGANIYGKDIISVLGGDTFDSDKERFYRDFNPEQTHKLIITTYQTAGAGQNLQYSIKENLFFQDNHIKLGNRESLEVDSNMIFLEKPTHVIPAIDNFQDNHTFIKALIVVSSFHNTGSISSSTYKSILKEIFTTKTKHLAYSYSYGCLYETTEYYNANWSLIEQAVGRICRTPNKRKEIYIYLDPTLRFTYNNEPHHCELITPEFRSIISAMEINGNNMGEIEEKLRNKAEVGCRMTMRTISSMLKNIRGDESVIRNWQFIRKKIMEKPTMNRKEYLSCKPWLQNFYMELPKKNNEYYYSVENRETMSGCVVSFKSQRGLTRVSGDSCYLTKLMSDEKFRRSFKEMNFATEFKKNVYILNPVAFNNLYKGALGEYIGEILFAEMKYKLKEVRYDAYEFFDYEIDFHDDTVPPLCIDFKNWNSDNIDADSQFAHIAQKAELYGTNSVIIINILNPTDVYIPYKKNVLTERDANIEIHVFPALLREDMQVNPATMNIITDIIDRHLLKAHENNKDK